MKNVVNILIGTCLFSIWSLSSIFYQKWTVLYELWWKRIPAVLFSAQRSGNIRQQTDDTAGLLSYRLWQVRIPNYVIFKVKDVLPTAYFSFLPIHRMFMIGFICLMSSRIQGGSYYKSLESSFKGLPSPGINFCLMRMLMLKSFGSFPIVPLIKLKFYARQWEAFER